MRTLLILLVGITFLPACMRPYDPDFDLVITNVHVVDIAQDRVYNDQMVGIKDGVIAMVQNMDSVLLDRYETRNPYLDGRGKYLMPGLWDNHVHFRGGDSLIGENMDLFQHFISHGITTIRDAGGDLALPVLQWRDARNTEPFLAQPRIFTCGPKLDGPDPAWPGSISVIQQEDVGPALDSLQSLNVDFVKLYDGSMTAEMYYALVKESEQRGLKVTGHMPMSASIMEAIPMGLDGTEHMHYLTKSCSPLEDSLTAEGLGYRMLPFIAESYDDELARSRFRTLAAHKVFVCPTLFISKTLSELADADHSADSMLPLMGEGIRSTYAMRIASAKRAKARGNTRRSRMLELSMQMIRPMQDEGILLLAGSDCGAFNSYVYPGQSLHQELYLLVESGLSPAEALASSVINGPAFFDQRSRFGEVEVGKVADLILLDGDPLKDIHLIETVSWVHHGSSQTHLR